MKKDEILIYLLVGLIVIFLISLGYFTWQKRNVKTVAANTSAVVKPIDILPEVGKTTKYDVPVLMYHYVRIAPEGDTLGKNLSVTPQNFVDQMAWLKQNNYATIKVSDLADPNKKEISKIIAENKKPIAVTFDDGYEDAYIAAYPALQKEGFIGTFYIIRDFIGRPGYMNQNQINELDFIGNEIGSHTLSHLDLSKNSEEVQQKQIEDSKQSAMSFCYPSGKYNETTVNLVKEAGYTTAVTTKSGIVNQDSNLLELKRVRVNDGNAESLRLAIEKAYSNGN